MRRVIWFHRAVSSLRQIGDYIAVDSPKSAHSVLLRIKATADLLAETPYIGRPGRVEGTRELVVPDLPYILPYLVREQEVIILHVLHASRKWPECF